MINTATKIIQVASLGALITDIQVLISRNDSGRYDIYLAGVSRTGFIQLRPNSTNLREVRGVYWVEAGTNPSTGLTAYNSLDGWVFREFALPGFGLFLGSGLTIFNTWENSPETVEGFVELFSLSKVRKPWHPLSTYLSRRRDEYSTDPYLHPRPPKPVKPFNIKPRISKYWGGAVTDIILKG